MFELRLCTKCEPNHYENCPECFGFGHYINKDGTSVIVAAGQAEKFRNDEIIQYELNSCAYCGGTIYGNKQ